MSESIEVTLVRVKGVQSRPGLVSREIVISGKLEVVEKAVGRLTADGDWALVWSEKEEGGVKGEYHQGVDFGQSVDRGGGQG